MKRNIEELNDTQEFNDDSDQENAEDAMNAMDAVLAAMPSKKIMTFTYNDTTRNELTFDAFTTFRQYKYFVNDLHNLSSVSGSTNTVGFTEWAQFYNRYYVDWCRITTTFINTAAFPVHVGILFRPITSASEEPDPSTWDTWIQISNGNEFPCITELLTPAGGSKDRVTLSVNCRLGNVWGNTQIHQGSVDFSGDVTGSPNQPQKAWVFVLNKDGQIPNNLLNPLVDAIINLKTTITVQATMYQRKTLTG